MSMIIDCHNHVLGAGYPGYEKFIKEMTLGYFRSLGKLPTERMPVAADWKGLEYLWEPIDPQVLIADHDKVGIDGASCWVWPLRITRPTWSGGRST